MPASYGIVNDMKVFNYSRKIVYDTETCEILTFEEWEKKQNEEAKETQESNQ